MTTCFEDRAVIGAIYKLLRNGIHGLLEPIKGRRYCGGDKQHPTYHDLGDHTETIEMDYDPSVVSYAVKLARSTRPDSPEAPANIKKYVSWGAGPRASQYLILGAKARAAMDGRAMPDLEDVAAMALPVLSHRVVVNFQAEAEGVTAESLIQTGGSRR